MAFLCQKTVLVTGGSGTVGRELIRQIVRQRPGEIRVVDCQASGLRQLESDLAARSMQLGSQVPARFEAADVRDANAMHCLCKGVDIVFHLAAQKHVAICECAPKSAMQTNVRGVKNLIDAASACGVERVIFTSSDKAVNPIGVMGVSKLIGEQLIGAANDFDPACGTIFASTRFGNVLGSQGSVVPIFFRQIRAGGPVTLTDRRMTRFVMTVRQSVRLLLAAAELARGSEVFIPRMRAMRIADLARVMVDLLAPRFGHSAPDVPIEEVGAEPREKLHEELMTAEESRCAWEMKNMFVLSPDAGVGGVRAGLSSRVRPMPLREIRRFLIENDVLASCGDWALEARAGAQADPAERIAA